LGLAATCTIWRDSGWISTRRSAHWRHRGCRIGHAQSCNGVAAGDGGQAYKAGADPSEPTNKRYFATNANAAIFEDNVSLFAVMPEIGEPSSGHVIH